MKFLFFYIVLVRQNISSVFLCISYNILLLVLQLQQEYTVAVSPCGQGGDLLWACSPACFLSGAPVREPYRTVPSREYEFLAVLWCTPTYSRILL